MTFPAYPFGETVNLITRTVTGHDADGNEVYGDVSTPIEHVPVWPRTSSELVQGQDTAIVGLTALLPYDTDISHIDALEVYGARYEVDGEPGPYASPFTGAKAGREVKLTRVEG